MAVVSRHTYDDSNRALIFLITNFITAENCDTKNLIASSPRRQGGHSQTTSAVRGDGRC